VCLILVRVKCLLPYRRIINDDDNYCLLRILLDKQAIIQSGYEVTYLFNDVSTGGRRSDAINLAACQLGTQ